jgi:putative sugar O-methyltransferase
MDTKNTELKDDFGLLDRMLEDSRNQPPLYQAGPYWAATARAAAKEIKEKGIGGFRGSESLIGMSFADNLQLDARALFTQSLPRRLARWATMTYPLSRVFDAQKGLTKAYADSSRGYLEEVLNLRARPKELLKKYTLPYSLLGGCLSKVKLADEDRSIHYMNLLEQHDNAASRVDFRAARSIFEIGGGFGVNVHLLIENYPNIRKVLYLDIPPNLYVGTQYLKAFYGAAVSDYRALAGKAPLTFASNDALEILCVAPWQIEEFRSPVDVFVNSHSFVEMPRSVVENYAAKFQAFPGAEDAAIVLTTYDGADHATLEPKSLPGCFKGRAFDAFEAPNFLDSARKNLYFVSPGRLAASAATRS